MVELTWGTPIFLCALYGLVRFVAKRKGDDTSIGWTPLESVGVTLLIYFVSQLFVGLTVYMVFSLFGWQESRITSWLQGALGQFIAVVLIDAMSLAMLVSFLKRRGGTLKTIGLKGRPGWRDLGYALAGFGAYFALYTIFAIVVKQLAPSVNFDQKQELGFDAVRSVQLPLVFISLVILPPFIEELLMRGFLYTGLRSKLPKYVATLFTSVLFAIAHLQAGSSAPLLWVAALDTFVLSLVLIHIRDRTDRLWAPMFLHAIKNGIAFTALFIFHVR